MAGLGRVCATLGAEMTEMLFGAAAALSLLFWLGFSTRGPSWVKSLIKTASVALLAAAALTAGGPFWLVAALMLGAVGDFCLSRHGERWFLGGVAAFALAHIAYIVLFQQVDGFDLAQVTQGWRATTALALVAFAVVMARLLWPRTGALRGAVMIYLCIIVAMGLAALGLPVAGLAMLAALFFVISDAVLAAELFLIPKGHRAHFRTPYVVWATYWGAQALFYWAFALA